MIDDLGGFGLGDPSKHTERQVDFHNLLHQRYRSLFLVPSNCKWGCSEKRGLSAFSTYLAKNHGDFNIIRLKETRNEMEIKFLENKERKG